MFSREEQKNYQQLNVSTLKYIMTNIFQIYRRCEFFGQSCNTFVSLTINHELWFIKNRKGLYQF